MVYYRILSIVCCVIHQDLVFFPFCVYQFASANPQIPVQSSPTLPPLSNYQSVLCVPNSISVL